MTATARSSFSKGALSFVAMEEHVDAPKIKMIIMIQQGPLELGSSDSHLRCNRFP